MFLSKIQVRKSIALHPGTDMSWKQIKKAAVKTKQNICMPSLEKCLFSSLAHLKTVKEDYGASLVAQW